MHRGDLLCGNATRGDAQRCQGHQTADGAAPAANDARARRARPREGDCHTRGGHRLGNLPRSYLNLLIVRWLPRPNSRALQGFASEGQASKASKVHRADLMCGNLERHREIFAKFSRACNLETWSCTLDRSNLATNLSHGLVRCTGEQEGILRRTHGKSILIS